MTNQEIQNITLESLRDWFKKEKWVRISSSGNIAGPCGTSKNKKNPDRCLPKAKAQSLSKAQRAATARKKKKAGAKGKTVVKNTKAAKVTRENNDRSFTKDDMLTYVYETIGGYLERYLGYNPGPPDHPMYKMTPKQMSAYIAQQFMDGIDELLDETEATIELIREGIEEAYEDYKKISMGVGHDPDMHFEPEEEKIGADALEMVLQTLDKMATPTKLETANPQDGKAAPYGSGYKPIKKMKKETKEAPAGHYFTKSGNLVKGRMSADAKERGARKSDPKDKQRSKVPPVSQTREDIRNLVVGTLHEMQNEGKSHTIDLGNIKSDDLWMIASHLKDATINGKTGPISDLISQAADMLEDSETESLNEKDDRCTRLAKQKYDTWPSAYASGAVVRCRRGEIWKKK